MNHNLRLFGLRTAARWAILVGGIAAVAACGSSDGTGGFFGGQAGATGTTVVIFLIDGLQFQAVETAVANGATNMKFLLDNGVRAELSHPSSPAVTVQLPDGSTPNGGASSGNTTLHTGTHLIEAPSAGMDDIFKGCVLPK